MVGGEESEGGRCSAVYFVVGGEIRQRRENKPKKKKIHNCCCRHSATVDAGDDGMVLKVMLAYTRAPPDCLRFTYMVWLQSKLCVLKRRWGAGGQRGEW